jgi:hypothetical protein
MDRFKRRTGACVETGACGGPAPRLKRAKAVLPKKARAPMEALLPILIFVVAVIAVNVYEFGRPD